MPPREGGEVPDGHPVDPRSALVRLHPFPGFGEVPRFEDLLDHVSFPRGSMLPSAPALKFASPSGVIGWLVRGGVDTLLVGSALRRVECPLPHGFRRRKPLDAWPQRSEGNPPVSLFARAYSSPRLVPPATMASADFPPPSGGGISPGNGTLLRRTAAAFTSRGIPDAFGVLCHLDAPCRPSMRFLSIGSRFSPSLPSPLRLPLASWLQMVVSSFSCSGIPTGDLNPICSVPMLGTHKAVVDNRLPLPSRNEPYGYNP